MFLLRFSYWPFSEAQHTNLSVCYRESRPRNRLSSGDSRPLSVIAKSVATKQSPLKSDYDPIHIDSVSMPINVQIWFNGAQYS